MFYRTYTGDDGETHFEAIDSPKGPVNVDPNGTISITHWEPGHFVDLHPAPRRQFHITLSGTGELVSTNGTRQAFGPGDVNLVEDLTGKGHTTAAIGDETRVFISIPLA